jgi:hypothetical protein
MSRLFGKITSGATRLFGKIKEQAKLITVFNKQGILIKTDLI